MAITSAVCNSYKQEILSGTHASGDTYKIALIKAAPTGTFGAGTTNYSNLGTDEASGTGYTAGGATLSGFSTTLNGSTGCLDFTAPSWASSTISADGCLIYNSSKSNKAVAVFAFGSTITSTNGTFTINMPTVGSGTSLIRIA